MFDEVIIPSELHFRIIAHIHADGPYEQCIFTLREAADTHAQVSLVSHAWCRMSRKVQNETIVVDGIGPLCNLLEMLQKPGCTIAQFTKTIRIGDFIAHGWGTTRGWAGDYIDPSLLFSLIPNVRSFQFLCIEHPSLPDYRRVRHLEKTLTQTTLPTTVSTLTLRPDFFPTLNALFEFVHTFQLIERLALFGISSSLLQNLPRYLPSTVKALKLVENCVDYAHGPRPVHQSGPMMITASEGCHLDEVLYYNISNKLFPQAHAFLERISQLPLLLEVAYPVVANASANAPVEARQLYESLAQGRATVAVMDETRKVFGSNEGFSWADPYFRSNRIQSG